MTLKHKLIMAGMYAAVALVVALSAAGYALKAYIEFNWWFG